MPPVGSKTGVQARVDGENAASDTSEPGFVAPPAPPGEASTDDLTPRDPEGAGATMAKDRSQRSSIEEISGPCRTPQPALLPPTTRSLREGPADASNGSDQERNGMEEVPVEGVPGDNEGSNLTENVGHAPEVDASNREHGAETGGPEPGTPLPSDSGGLPPPLPPSPRRRKLKPEKLGGRPRGGGEPDGSDSSTDEGQVPGATRKAKPELVCWRQGMNWVVGLEVTEPFADGQRTATQRSSLTEHERRPGRWSLEEPLAAVEVLHGDLGEAFTFPDESFRIFKLFGSQLVRGRYMKCLTRGRFLVVAPNDWQPASELSGREIQAPEYVVGARCRAHLFEVPDPTGGAPVFITAAGGRQSLPTTEPGFELEGVPLEDAHPDAGPLFGGEPPQLRCVRNMRYAMAVVGEEGPRGGRSAWRDHGRNFEELRPRIADRRAGWFFVRLYDDADDLIDSLDFRFSSQLHAIQVGPHSPMPAPDGHSTARVHLMHGPDCEVAPLTGGAADGLSVTRTSDGCCLQIPPCPGYDETLWMIKERNGGEVAISLRVNRVWWSVADEAAKHATTAWGDHPLDLHVNDFAATSRRVLRIRVPQASWARDVRVGVDPDRRLGLRPVPGRPAEVELPIRDLGRFFANQVVNVQLKLWARPEEGNAPGPWEAVVARIAAPGEVAQARIPARLALEVLDPVRVMTVLSRARRRCGERHKRMIDLLRQVHYRSRWHIRQCYGAKRDNFLREALCLLAAVMDEHSASGQSLKIRSRWARRAELARVNFPGTFEAVRNAGALPTRQVKYGTDPGDR